MSELIDAVIKTREITADIFAKILVDIDKNSEIEVRKKILSEVKNHDELFPLGWYDPPAGGVGVLFDDQKPFKRLQFDSLRKSEYWPNETSKFKKETVGMIYFSPVDCKTNMIGDIGFSVYKGENAEIKKHIKICYSAILNVAEHAEVGMSFSELCIFAKQLFQNKFKITKWITLFLHPLSEDGVNLGHTVPGTFETNFDFGKSFGEVRETIRTKRIFINSGEKFKIPETCAMTIEVRLADAEKEYLPNVYFHFIVCFDKGKKIILENFSEIFKVVGMNYMQEK